MTNFVKRLLFVLFISLLGFSLVACSSSDISKIIGIIDTADGGGGNNTKNASDVVAKLNEALIGRYTADDVTVDVYESKVVITDPSGKSLEFTLYANGDEIYIYEEGIKIVCTFSADGSSVTNTHGTFNKVSSDERVVAHLDQSLIGTYYSDGITVRVFESKVVITESDGKTMEYTLYVKDDSIYVVEENVEIICTFSADGSSVSNAFGTFIKRGSGSGQGTTDQRVTGHVDTRYIGEYYKDGVYVVVEESKATVIEPNGNTTPYALYTKNDQIYFLYQNQEIFCTFGVENGDEYVDVGVLGKYSKSHGNEQGGGGSQGSGGGSQGSGGGTTGREEIAHLDQDKIGTYTDGKETVQVYESKVEVTDNKGNKSVYTLYTLNEQLFVIVDGGKVFCTFGVENGNLYVQNTFGKFYKTSSSGQGSESGQGSGSGQGTTETHTPVKLSAEKQGIYQNASQDITIKVEESSVMVVYSNGGTGTYDLYISEDSEIYFLYNGNIVVCRFSADGSSVSNSFGIFTKKSSGSQEGGSGQDVSGSGQGSESGQGEGGDGSTGSGSTPETIDSKYIGKYVNERDSSGLFITEQGVSITPSQGEPVNCPLSIENGQYSIVYNGEKLTLRFNADGSTVSVSGLGTFRKVV